MPDMPMPQAQGAQDPQGSDAPSAGQPAAPAGGASQLVASIHDQLMSLMDLLDKSKAVTPEDKQALGGIISAYQSFVQDHLGAGPGQKPPGAEAPQASETVSPEAGASGAKPY